MAKAKEKLELITQFFTDFTSVQIKQLEALEELYRDWNSRINVISRKDEQGLYEKHVLHSLSIAAAFDIQKEMKVLDLGTGGGFPGIPLAIFFPEAHFFLADSIGKKIKVVEAVVEGLGLKNITARHTRVEDIKGLKFDSVVSRAVAPLAQLWSWSKPLLRKNTDANRAEDQLPVPNGLICLKGGDLSMEISESNTRPRLMEIHELFPLDSFRDKFIVYIPQ